jgi:hypothetical protein
MAWDNRLGTFFFGFIISFGSHTEALRIMYFVS